ncbi:hypothetical protein Tco_0379843 [Tanacetum coccineum]
MVFSCGFYNNCVACNKGKQHKASYKHISAVRLITETLQLLHMDLYDHNRIAYLGRERGSEDFTDILSYLDHSPLRFLQMLVAIETADRTSRPTSAFTRKLFSNMRLKWAGEEIPLTPPVEY